MDPGEKALGITPKSYKNLIIISGEVSGHGVSIAFIVSSISIVYIVYIDI